MRHCIFAIGTRAQLVKVAPVLRCAVDVGIRHSIWLSGQHLETMDDLISDFDITSTVRRVQTETEKATLGGLLTWTPRAFIRCIRYVRQIAKTDSTSPIVVVHGDTLSTLIAAAAGRFAGASVVHLESGLTSGRLLNPFPEEAVRRLTFLLTHYAVCPTTIASRRMLRYRCREIVNTRENTLLDCVRYALRVMKPSTRGKDTYFVASIHRVENIYRKATLNRIIKDILSVATDEKVHFVLHPATKKRLVKSGLWSSLERSPSLKLEPRMSYTAFLSLLAGARGVFSDGGSNQEELSYLGVPTVLFRERSERLEGLGKNIILRNSIGDLPYFVRSGSMDKLRKTCCLHDEASPSRDTAEALLRWSKTV